MATPHSPARTCPAENQEVARVPPVDSTTEINSVMVPYPVPDVTAGEPDVIREPTWSAMVLPKLRPFNKDHVNIWFIQVEASMNLARITSDTMKFYYIMSELDPDIFSLVEDIAEAPPATDKYPAIKKRLLQLFSQSTESKVRRLLTCRRGDEKPSHFLQRLKSLAGRNVPDVLLKVIFLEQVPDTLRSILLAKEDTDLFELALLADKVIELEAFVSTVSRSNTAREDNMTTTCQALSQQITELASQLEELKIECSRQHGRQRRRRSKSRNRRSPARRRSQSTERNTGLCYYHRRFGAQAYRCAVPCTW